MLVCEAAQCGERRLEHDGADHHLLECVESRPAGFFFSSMRRAATAPNRWIHLVHAGAVSLAAGAVALGIGLLQVAPPA